MTKAEKKALEKYPANKTVFDKYEKQRYAFICGYIQAEKDLELTWEDINDIIRIYEDVLETKLGEDIYIETLNRFNKLKGK
jgi:hypothetical protein